MHYDDQREKELLEPWLMQGDCLERMKEIPDGSIDMVLTDPPYKVTSRGGHTNAGGMMLDDEMRKGKVFKHNKIIINDWLGTLYRVLVESGHCYVMTNNKNITEFLKVVDNSEFHLVKCLVWAKDNKIMSQAYMSQFEYILFLRKGKFKKINNCGTSDLIHAKNPKNKIHPTQKPVELMEVLISNSSNEGDTILDPFMGAGSAGLAAKNLNRKFIGIELDENYFNIAKTRITGEE